MSVNILPLLWGWIGPFSQNKLKQWVETTSVKLKRLFGILVTPNELIRAKTVTGMYSFSIPKGLTYKGKPKLLHSRPHNQSVQLWKQSLICSLLDTFWRWWQLIKHSKSIFQLWCLTISAIVVVIVVNVAAIVDVVDVVVAAIDF